MLVALLQKDRSRPEIGQRDPIAPTGSEVNVKVLACGICHSDLHLCEGGYDFGRQQGFVRVSDRGIPYPIVPGHEIVGRVEALGPEVTRLKLGQQVLVYPWIGCGHCPNCLEGQDSLCPQPQSVGLFRPGGYAEELQVPHEKYCLDVTGMDPASTAPLACCGLTAYSAVKKALQHPSKSWWILGMGGLGMSALGLARHFGVKALHVVDPSPEKREAALGFGARSAHDKLPASPRDAPSCILDFVNNGETAGWSLEKLQKGGLLVSVGFFGGSVEVPLPSLPMRALTWQGSYTGSLEELEELVEISRKSSLYPKLGRRYSLQQVGEALDALETGNEMGRGVIVFE